MIDEGLLRVQRLADACGCDERAIVANEYSALLAQAGEVCQAVARLLAGMKGPRFVIIPGDPDKLEPLRDLTSAVAIAPRRSAKITESPELLSAATDATSWRVWELKQRGDMLAPPAIKTRQRPTQRVLGEVNTGRTM